MKLLPPNHLHLKKSSGFLKEEPPGVLNKAQLIVFCKQRQNTAQIQNIWLFFLLQFTTRIFQAKPGWLFISTGKNKKLWVFFCLFVF